MRMNDHDEVDIRECVVDFWVHKPRFQKEKVLVNWIEDMGFDSINSKVELDESTIKDRLSQVVTKIDKTTFNILGKDIRKLKTLKELDSKNKNFIEKGLKFINGSLSTYFGISIVRKSRNEKISNYVLKNKNIDAGLFRTQDGESNIPRLGEEVIESDEEQSDDDFKGAMERLGFSV